MEGTPCNKVANINRASQGWAGRGRTVRHNVVRIILGFETLQDIMSQDATPPSTDTTSQSSTLKREKIDIDNYGSPVGKNGSKVATKIGKLVRNHVPISYPSWKKVPPNYKEDVWNQLEKYYELDPLSKDLIMKKMPEAFRRHKNDLRKNHYDHFITDEERMRNCPPKIAQDDWDEFIRNESKPEAKEKRKRGKQNRSMLEYGHHSGRKSHAMITQEMVDSSSPGTEVSRLQVWEKTHKKKDGSTSDATSSYFDKIEKEKETTSGGDEAVFISVFGKDVKGRSRSIGTNIAPSQVKSAAIPCKRLKQAQGIYEQRLQNVEQKLMKLDNMDDKLERLLSIAQDNRQVGSEITSSQFATPNNQLIDQRCEILNFEDEVIATGTICRDSTALVIHGKAVPPTYEKVLLDKILLPNELTAKICRQFTETFGDVGVGGYVSHQKGLIRYL